MNEPEETIDSVEAFFEENVTQKLIHRLASTEDAVFCEETGDELYAGKSYESALMHYTAAIEINAQSAVLFNKRGMTFYALKNMEKALLDYTEAIRLGAHLSFFYNRCLAFKRLQRYEEAIRDLMRVIELNPWDEDMMGLMIRLRLAAKVKVPYF